ncbi:hypothetical protein TRAPUB_5622 [Trametes pubescens]|uniref:Uncharacterized protein n=1 Tax=Trametes pubescens TaxID=154538 RepID=A0A1M2V7Z3_TRAPU|nr:hypothetical protein TRAPUB_5622 [Trametes pubescens]
MHSRRSTDAVEYQARATGSRGLVRLRPAPVLRREAVPAKLNLKANIGSSLPSDAGKRSAEDNIVDVPCLEGDAAAHRPITDPLAVPPTTRTRRTSHVVSPAMVTFPQSSTPSTSALDTSSALCRPDIPPSHSPHQHASSSRSITRPSITVPSADQQSLQQAVSPPAAGDAHRLEYDVLSAEVRAFDYASVTYLKTNAGHSQALSR